MCGIAGAFSFAGSDFRVSAPYLDALRDTLVHRGPDDAGTWVRDDGAVGLAARRLAIIDRSPQGAQPMANEDGRVLTVFNGAIYNHQPLRRELEARGHRFRSDHSDTEVIVHAYEEWGIACVERFRGMFAFALWDDEERTLWLVRDRIGIKPLFYSVHDRRLVFGSEIKALLADPAQRRVLDREALFHYLSFLTTPAPLTMFAGIRKVPPATAVRVGHDGTVTETRYWSVLDTEPATAASRDGAAASVLATLRESVALRKLADVPVGVFLSGGVDSSGNAALFAEGEAEPIDTYTVGYAGSNRGYPNEFEWARRVAAAIGADHHELVLDQDRLLAFLPEMVRWTDEPIADPVAAPVHALALLAREHGTIVCQLGEGADELFYGYPSWRVLRRLQLADNLPVPAAAKRLAHAGLAAGGAASARSVEYLRRAAAGTPVFWGGAEAFTHVQKRRLLSPALRRELGDLSSWDAIAPLRTAFLRDAPQRTPLHWMTYLDLNVRLPELLLARVDRMTMAASLEARVPFLDHRLVELAFSLPERTLVGGGTLKSVLKAALRGVVPDDVLDRRKQGFRLPVEDWLAGPLGAFARATVLEFCDESGLLDRRETERILGEGRRDVWYLLNLAIWWREFRPS